MTQSLSRTGQTRLRRGGLALIAFAIGTLAQVMPVTAAEKTCDPAGQELPEIAAFCDSDAVRNEIAKYPSEDWEPSPVSLVTELHGICGVTGCDYTYLVGQSFTTKGVNPQTATVLAIVSSNPIRFRTSSARLVKIVSADAIVTPRAWSRLCSGDDNKPGSETTAGQRACLEKEVKRQQGGLDAVLRKARATMAPAGHPLDPEWSEKRLALFEQSQKAWEDYRAAACDAAHHEIFPGSFAPLERLDCLYSVTGVRVGELMRMYISVD